MLFRSRGKALKVDMKIQISNILCNHEELENASNSLFSILVIVETNDILKERISVVIKMKLYIMWF